jgi:hypothetical protein
VATSKVLVIPCGRAAADPAACGSVPDTGRQVSPALHGVAPESGVLEFAMESGYQHALYFSLRYLAMYARWVTK